MSYELGVVGVYRAGFFNSFIETFVDFIQYNFKVSIFFNERAVSYS